MTRKSIAIDMDEVLADTVGALIEDVNKRTDLGITYDMLDGKKLRHAMPEHDGLLHEILREPGFFKKLKVMAHSQKVVKKITECTVRCICCYCCYVCPVFIACDICIVKRLFSVLRPSAFCILRSQRYR